VAGPAGATGPEGKAGPLLSVLPAGKSERGFWAASSGEVPEVSPASVTAKISFPVPLEEPLEETHVVLISLSETGKPPASRSATKVKPFCGSTGTLNHPTAEPGYLCVYTGVEKLVDLVEEGAQEHEELGEPREPLTGPVKAGSTTNAKALGIQNLFNSQGAENEGADVAFVVKETRSEVEEGNQEYPNITVSGSWAVTAF
jgi:hypothetical protein